MKQCINDCICGGRVIIGFFNGQGNMSNQPRVTRVLVVLLVSMTTGAVVLMALGQSSAVSGAFLSFDLLPA